MNYRELNGKSILDGFTEFHSKNPSVYRAFEREALRAIKRGRKKISAKLLINWIRWNNFIETGDDNFKINDAYQSYYARLFVTIHPHHKGIFEFRKLRNEESGPYMSVDSKGQISFL